MAGVTGLPIFSYKGHSSSPPDIESLRKWRISGVNFYEPPRHIRCYPASRGWAKEWHFFGVWVFSLVKCIIFAFSV